jgi:single-stranded-DNA-specific exonuclease
MPQPQWQVRPPTSIPVDFLKAVKTFCPDSDGQIAAQLLWQRGINTIAKLLPFIDSDRYHPTSPFVFGQEMKWAVQRLKKAREAREKVTIWGDFDADGITATSVLWEGLGEFFSPGEQLSFYIPNRLTESHGLNIPQLEKLRVSGTKLIITCDTGSTNLAEIEYAQALGLDIIITDHHTLPDQRPPVLAIINPRYFAEDHPLYHLSGVAVAYKLMEALYETLPDIPRSPITDLLDLVAIGLIADLVQLQGDCRYLAQKGIQKLQKQLKQTTRPGIAALLKLCQKNGDRPTDISFGIGPRINAISRIQGDATFAVELLTSRDDQRCQQLAEETELANTRRKALQKTVAAEVNQQLERLDLSTTGVIVLADRQWPGGVLGLVASQIAQDYGRPTLLLTQSGSLLRGSARSVRGINLYELLKSQQHLITGFGGHPFAAGLSLPVENLSLFREAINQQFRQSYPDSHYLRSQLEIDATVTVSQLGKTLFRELRLLEPCGMGNPAPKLRLNHCTFQKVWNKNMQDAKGNKVQYLKTTFLLLDDTVTEGFPGIWWGHNKDEIPVDQACDVVVELDFNTYHDRYEVRLIDLRLSQNLDSSTLPTAPALLDWRQDHPNLDDANNLQILEHCPKDWPELQRIYRTAQGQTDFNGIAEKQVLALAYQVPEQSPEQILDQFIGLAKALSQQQGKISLESFQQRVGLSEANCRRGLALLRQLGFPWQEQQGRLQFFEPIAPSDVSQIPLFLAAIAEELFQRQYFAHAPINTLQELLQNSLNLDLTT